MEFIFNPFILLLTTTTVFISTMLLLIFTFFLINYLQPLGKPSSPLKRTLLGSMGWPFIGETLDFIACGYTDHPESFMEKRRLLYGKVFKSHLFGNPTIISTDAKVSRIILQSDANSFVPSYPKSLTELMGECSILRINGSFHRRIHGLIGSFFKSPYLKAQVTSNMQKLLLQSMATWKEDRPIYIQDETKHIAFQVLAKALIGLDPGQEMDFLMVEFRKFIAGLMSIPINLPGTQLHRSLDAKKKMVRLILKIIRDKRVDGLDRSQQSYNVADVLLNDKSEKLTDELISDNMIDLMIPGEDSVPMLMTLAIKYLSDCPKALHQLKEENLGLKRRKENLGDTLSWDDYLSLPFTQSVITETLRMGNIIMGVIRKAMRDVEIKGYLIPKGWRVLTHFRSVHFDECYHESPHQFNPWRWQDKNMSNCNSIGFTPFGGGLRLCPGLDLARLEASIFLHHFVTAFRWIAEKDTIINFPTVKLKNRMPIWVKKEI
ncbi:3-epi-6-deoxocathasterone 23-monooxygenase CYP90D1-like [Rutidosis leptorrhynchoides]|uniref:3-epi-6-deoxocathasterone 23-monooxygenase CYP90D1-like n=1 Tax=Rutidosis leptorrhynchoides TaxID=125765 RepID=UPI003A9927B5